MATDRGRRAEEKILQPAPQRVSAASVLHVKFYQLADDVNTERAREALNKLTNIAVVDVLCPPGKAEYYEMPFIKSEVGTYFGVDDIQAFVAGQLGEVPSFLERARSSR